MMLPFSDGLPRMGPFSHPPHSTQEPFLTPQPPKPKGFLRPPSQESGLGRGAGPSCARGAHLAASEASSLDAQRPR